MRIDSRLVLALLVLAGLLAIAVPRLQSPEQLPRVTWIATAHQHGPVGYRDPLGAISPDGRWIAYSEGRFLRVRPLEGGPGVDFPPGDAQIRHLVWNPDSRTILADGNASGWALYDREDGTRRPLFAGGPSPIRQAAWSPDGKSIAGVVNGRDGAELWVFSPATGGLDSRVQRLGRTVSFPAWTPRGEIACITTIDGRQRLTIPCGASPVRINPDLDVYGPIAFSSDGANAFLAMPNDGGTVDLWAVPTGGGRARRLTGFSRDSYGPSVAADGTVLFKVQSYRTVVAQAPAEGGATARLASFRTETPSWDPTGRWLGVTYGTWRRVVDDARYPDIAQEAGIIALDPARPAAKPSQVVDASISEDQSLCWSPNGKWIAYHSHKDQSDDVWLRPARGDAQGRRISFLGRGAETGWPRWSADGRWILFDGASKATHDGVMYVIGVDQETGAVTSEAREVAVRGISGDVSHGEWVGGANGVDGSRTIVALAKEAPGRHAIFTVPREGGDAHIVHRFASEHDAPGLGVSPDGAHVAFVAPAADGYFQIFRMPLAGGPAVQVTRDPSNKTQPAWSPDGRTIAFTVWSYDCQFWTLR